MTNEIAPPDDAAWAGVRARYEKAEEAVQAIAETVGLSAMALSRKAKDLGWTLRGKKSAAKVESTRVTIKRLKELLQQRLSHLEAQLNDISADVTALSGERDLRSMNTLVRTLEKVLDLERKDNFRKRKAAREFKHFDDQQRGELAEKIAKLQDTWHGQPPVPDTAAGGGGGTEQAVAVLGAEGPATAA